MKKTIIVGFGLAGFHYAKILKEQGKDFLVISDESKGASRNAGGILNPTILKRYKMSWNAIKFYDHAINTYRTFEKDYQISVFKETPIYNYFNQISDHNNWSVAAETEGLNKFLLPPIIKADQKNIKCNYGYAKLKNVGKIEVQKMLDIFKDYLTPDSFLEELFEYHKLKVYQNNIEYKGLKAENIVFCEGYGIKKNPWFSYLPLIGSKGEFLHVRTKRLSQNVIIKAGIFIVPIGNDLFWVGATFSRDDKTIHTTNAGKEWLLSKLKKMLLHPFKIVYHGAAIRPTVKDRRPLMGEHPKEKRLFVFNGLGTRGILMAPLLAKWFYEHIEAKKNLPSMVSIQRYQTYFSNT
tara:strand:- start:329 stop:1381 length:1053 start_codon:yes stop_codon:yes gene_type:complete